MMIGTFGYGRYNDEPDVVGCPRTKSGMTPCIARDGTHALAENSCVGCGFHPKVLLDEIADELHVTYSARSAKQCAEKLRQVVREITEPLVRND